MRFSLTTVKSFNPPAIPVSHDGVVKREVGGWMDGWMDGWMHPSWNFTERIAGCGLVPHTLVDAVSDLNKTASLHGLFLIATTERSSSPTYVI